MKKPTKAQLKRWREVRERNFCQAIEAKDGLSIEHYGYEILEYYCHEAEIFAWVLGAILDAGLMSQEWKFLFEQRFYDSSKGERIRRHDSMRRLYLWDKDYAKASMFLPISPEQPEELADDVYVTDCQPVLQGLTWEGARWAFTNLAAGFWHPLTWLSHMADVQFYGLQPGGHHLTAVLLHVCNTCLLFLLLHGMTRALWRSAMVAGLFALHPLHVEAVAWVSERKEVLSTFFGLLTLIFYARYASPARGAAAGVRSGRPAAVNYLLSLFFFVCALMSKAMAVTLPVMLLLLDVWPLGRFSFPAAPGGLPLFGPGLRRLFLEKVPFFVLGVLAGLTTIQAENNIGALMSVGRFPLAARIASVPITYLRYLGEMFWPAGLALPYPPPGPMSLTVVVLAVVALLELCGLAFLLRRRQPYWVMGWCWYLFALLPVSGLIQIGGHSHADRYTYVPLTGIFILLVWGGVDICRHWRVPKGFMFAAGAAVLLICALRTFVQLGYWQNDEKLYSHTVAVTKDNSIAHNSLGAALADRGRWQEALEQYRQALQINPNYSSPHLNIGNVYKYQGKPQEALEEYARGLQLKQNSPLGHFFMANMLADLGRPEEAVSQYELALQLKPYYIEAELNLGSALAKLGRIEEAVPHFRRTVQFKPDLPGGWCNLGVALAKLGRLEEAVQYLQKACQLEPDSIDARVYLGNALVAMGKTDEALRQFQQALGLAVAQNDTAFADAIRNRIRAVASQNP